MADFVAGAVGFTITWDPRAGQPGNIDSLAGLTVNMIVTNQTTLAKQTFTMTVASNGLTASYTTQAATDFPTAASYAIAFQAINPGGGLALETPSILRSVAAPL
jgi:hypothetical protein